jgi:uncharacterized damage-inducible protein DinB
MLQTLRNVPDRIAEVVEALSGAGDDWQPQPEDWTCRQLVAHLSAADPLFEKRLARIVAEDNPWLLYFGPDTANAPPVAARPEADAPLPELLSRFRTQRDRLLKFLSALPPEAWERPAVHETMGPTTFAQQVQNIINHDTDHLGQLHDLRRAWKSQAHG